MQSTVFTVAKSSDCPHVQSKRNYSEVLQTECCKIVVYFTSALSPTISIVTK